MDLFIDKKITKNLPPVSKINYGKYGICYKYNDMVLKIFTKKLEMYIKKNIKRNLKRESDIIMYPKDRVYIDNKKSLWMVIHVIWLLEWILILYFLKC